MKFLLTNDDGIAAPGLALLESAVRDLGEIVTVAPDQHLSGCSHQVTGHRALVAEPAGENRYALDGTPADCARVGVTHLANRPDWVLSGVNDGGNLGVDVFMSGTVAAVREAAWHGVPGIALSQFRRNRKEFTWDRLQPLIQRILRELWSRPLEPGAFWNVNLPDLNADDWQVLPEDVELVDCPLNPHPLPAEFEVIGDAYHSRGVYQQRERDPGTDVEICFGGRVAITKILPHHAG